MFNPSDLPISCGGAHGDLSFVGVRRNPAGNVEFCIPTGFDDFPQDDPEAANRLFFDLYKIFRRFSRGLSNTSSDRVQNRREGNAFDTKGMSFIDKDEELVTFYSKIPMLEAVLDSYDDLRVFLLTQQDGKTNELDYTRIDRYLSKAVYLEDDTAYIDVMVMPRDVVRYEVSDLVRMYCFLYLEIKRALDEEATLQGEVKAQAEIFKGQHLRTDSGLFIEPHAETIVLLKEILAEIHRQVSWKNADYWYFFDIIECFLYGELSNDIEGEHWGISRFSAIWEDLCMTWAFKEYQRENILFADTYENKNTIIGGFPVYVAEKFKNPFYIQHQDMTRFLRPDLVRKNNPKTVDHLFHETFEITQSSALTYKVKLKNKDKVSVQRLRSLSKFLSKGMRQFSLKIDSTNTFNNVIPSRYSEAIRFVKNGLMPIVRKQGRGGIIVVDFKYAPRETYTDSVLGDKAIADIRKQLIYEAALTLNGISESVWSQLCIPKYYSAKLDDLNGYVPDDELNAVVKEKRMQVVELDFVQLMDTYLSVE